jgi:hypothetical protein
VQDESRHQLAPGGGFFCQLDHTPLQAALCVWRDDPTPNDPVLRGAKGGAVGGGRALMRTFMQVSRRNGLIGVDRLRCKWLNLNFGCTTWMSLGGGLGNRSD